MNTPPIDDMYRIAKQYTRRPEEADDLVQDLLLEAVITGKDFSDARFMAWGRGFLRNHAAFIARTEGRRRKREERFHEQEHNANRTAKQLPKEFIAGLRPSLRVVARLVNCGLNRQEIQYLLLIADTAFRQRLTALRREWKAYIQVTQHLPEYPDDPIHTLASGLLRRSLIESFRKPANGHSYDVGRTIGSHDPDGHLFTIRSFFAHKTIGHGNNADDREE